MRQILEKKLLKVINQYLGRTSKLCGSIPTINVVLSRELYSKIVVTFLLVPRPMASGNTFATWIA